MSKAALDSGKVPDDKVKEADNSLNDLAREVEEIKPREVEPSQSLKTLDQNMISIITDQPFSQVVLDFGNYGNKLAEIIKYSWPQFSIGIFGGWGTGKSTLMMTIKEKLEDNPDILSVWIDAWRYEREKYLAVIPFLRQIRIKLDNEFRKNKKTGRRWNDVRNGLKRTFNALVESTELTAGFGDDKAASVSVKTNLGKFRDSLTSVGSIWTNDKKVQFHEHATDYLADALTHLRSENDKARIVVFIDDLDRCTPKKGLEILESIKSFFDIEGIVYVIGMNYNSIDFLIREKYGQNPNITGFDYMKKIVQLPFSMPEWNKEDISKFIDSIISTELKGSEIVRELSTNKDLIVRAIEWNPREVKRFINHIILVKAVFINLRIWCYLEIM